LSTFWLDPAWSDFAVGDAIASCPPDLKIPLRIHKNTHFKRQIHFVGGGIAPSHTPHPVLRLYPASTKPSGSTSASHENSGLIFASVMLYSAMEMCRHYFLHLTFLDTGSIARAAKHRYLRYSEADFSFFSPRRGDTLRRWRGGVKFGTVEERSPPPCQYKRPAGTWIGLSRV